MKERKSTLTNRLTSKLYFFCQRSKTDDFTQDDRFYKIMEQTSRVETEVSRPRTARHLLEGVGVKQRESRSQAKRPLSSDPYGMLLICMI